MNWYLKKADGQVFGPVDDDAVAQWAREGRILPEDLVSTDRQDWVAPSSIDALGLEWFIPMTDGTPYGPVHALAMAELTADGTLGLDDTVAHRTSREVRRVCEVLLPAMRHYCQSLRDSLLEDQARADKLEIERGLRDEEILRLNRKAAETEAAARQNEAAAHQRIQELQDGIAARDAAHGVTAEDAKNGERVRAELKEFRNIADQREKEIGRLKQLIEDETARSRKHEAELQQRIRQLQESELTLLKSVESAEGKAALAERKTGPAAGGGGDYGSLVQSYDDLTKNYDLLMDQFAAKSSDLNSAYAAIENLKKETDERVARIEATMRNERDDADKARQRLAKAEEAHLELVRSYRELNDRYIRYRQKMEAPGGPAETANGEAKPRVRLL